MAELLFISASDAGADDDRTSDQIARSSTDAEALDAYSQTVIRVAERLTPSVANLRVSRRVRGGRVLSGGGSGVVITPDGFLVTSAHVVANTDGRGRASFADGSDVEFDVVGADPLSDLAVLRAHDAALSAAELGEAEQLQRFRLPHGGPDCPTPLGLQTMNADRARLPGRTEPGHPATQTPQAVS